MVQHTPTPPTSPGYLMDHLPSIIFVWTPAEGLTYINHPVIDLLGYTPAELQESPGLAKQVLDPEYLAQLRMVINRLLQGTSPTTETITLRCRHKAGALVWLRTSLSAQPAESGAAKLLLGVAQDVTGQRKDLNTLRFQASLLSCLEAPLFGTNLRGQITLWNDGAHFLFGKPLDEVWGASLFHLLDLSAGETERLLDDLLSQAKIIREVRIKTVENRSVWVQLSGYVLKDEADLPIGLLFNPTDITNQKQARRQLARNFRELKALYNVSMPFNQLNDLGSWAQAIVDQLTRDLNYQAATLYLKSTDQGLFNPVALSWPGLNQYDQEAVLSWRKTHQFTDEQMPEGVTSGLPTAWLQNCPDHIRRRQQDIQSIFFVPLTIEQRTIGLLSLDSARQGAFSTEEKRLITTISRVIAIVVNNVQLLERERSERKISDTLREISAVLVSSLQLDKTLAIILESLEQLIPFDSAAIHLIAPNNRLKMVAGRGMPRTEETMASAKETDGFPLDEAVLSSKKPLAIADINQDQRWTSLRGTEYIRSWLGVPLLFRGRPLGLVTIDRARIDPFTADQISLAEAFAGHAAIALQNADLFSQVQVQQEQLRRLSNRVVAAQEEERRRISRELHDEMGQALTAIKLNLQMLLTTLSPEDHYLTERLDELVELSNDSLQEVRRLAMDLRPAMLDDLGLVPTLYWYQNQFQRRSACQLTLSVAPDLPRLSPEAETALYRVVQEALTNVSRHSGAGMAEISLSMDEEAIRFSIIDDGRGFSMEETDHRFGQAGVGLTSMFERIQALDGQIEISSGPGEGTCILISIPNEVAAQPASRTPG